MKNLLFIPLTLLFASPLWAHHDGLATVIVEVMSTSADQNVCKVQLKVESIHSSSLSGLEEGAQLENVIAPAQFCQLATKARAGVRLILQNNQLRIE